LLTTFNTEVVI